MQMPCLSARPICAPPCPYTTFFRSCAAARTSGRSPDRAHDAAVHVCFRRGGGGNLLAGGLYARHPARQTADDGRKSRDRKSTRLNSSHLVISDAVFCL